MADSFMNKVDVIYELLLLLLLLNSARSKFQRGDSEKEPTDQLSITITSCEEICSLKLKSRESGKLSYSK